MAGFWAGLGTIGALIFTIIQGHQALEGARRANEIAEANKRAWVKVRFSLASGLTWQGDLATVRAVAIMENVGDVPAAGVVLLRSVEVRQLESVEATQSEFSERALAGANIVRRERPVTLFPSEKTEVPFAIEIHREALMSIRREGAATVRTSRPIYIIGCAQYYLPGVRDPKQTGFALNLLRIDEDGCPVTIMDDDGDIVAANLVLMPHPRTQVIIT